MGLIFSMLRLSLEMLWLPSCLSDNDVICPSLSSRWSFLSVALPAARLSVTNMKSILNLFKMVWTRSTLGKHDPILQCPHTITSFHDFCLYLPTVMPWINSRCVVIAAAACSWLTLSWLTSFSTTTLSNHLLLPPRLVALKRKQNYTIISCSPNEAGHTPYYVAWCAHY